MFARQGPTSASSNIVTSPVSASLALTMAYAGARGQTATEMATALHFDPSAMPPIFDGQNALDQSLEQRASTVFDTARSSAAHSMGTPAPSPSDYDLTLVNSVWGEQSLPWSQNYLSTLAINYGAGVHVVDFIDQPDQARVAINDWVFAQTDDKIANLLPPPSIDESTRVVLVNAVHLKFPWEIPFDASASAPGPFTRADGTIVTATFMNGSFGLAYVDDGQAQIAALALADGNGVEDNIATYDSLTVLIALPHADVTLAAYEAALAPTSTAVTVPSARAQVQLSLPKLTYTTQTFSLKSALEAMGMNLAFTDQADFSRMVPGPQGLYIRDVLQKAMFSMQETGVEAAAATAVISVFHSFEGADTPITMVVNRPYLVTILDSVTGAILFVGHVTDPTDVGSP
jgi:serpin B